MCELLAGSYSSNENEFAALIYNVAQSPICPGHHAEFLESLHWIVRITIPNNLDLVVSFQNPAISFVLKHNLTALDSHQLCVALFRRSL